MASLPEGYCSLITRASHPQDDFCPIIFSRPFLNTVNAKIDCKKDVVTIGLGDMTHEFNYFAKFRK